MGVMLFAGGGLVLLLGGVASLTGPGLVVLGFVHWFLEFYVGVFSLVALSIAVMLGVAATDRSILKIQHRIMLQSFHRSMAMTSVVCLCIHVILKELEAHAYPIDIVVPFFNPGRTVYIGLGTLAAYFMVIVTWTGIIRGRFAGSKHPGMWRALHATAYMAWPFALLHGLLAGRSAKAWVIVSYILCVVLVLVGLLIRGGLYWGRRVKAPKATTTGAIKPVGKLAPLPPVAAPEAMEPPRPVRLERAAPRQLGDRAAPRQIGDRPRPPSRALPAGYQEERYPEERYQEDRRPDYPPEERREQLPTRRRALDESRIISAGPPVPAVAPPAPGGPRRPRRALEEPAPIQAGRMQPRRSRHSMDDGYPPAGQLPGARAPERGPEKVRDGYGRDAYPYDGYPRDDDLAIEYDAPGRQSARAYEAAPVSPPVYREPPVYRDAPVYREAPGYRDEPVYQAAPGYEPGYGPGPGYSDEPSRTRGARRGAPVAEPEDVYYDEARPQHRRRPVEDPAFVDRSMPDRPAAGRRSRRAAEEISDEEFWAHMRGEALR